MALSLQANYTEWATATCRRNLVPTFVDRGVSRGQRGRSLTVVNLSFLTGWITITLHNYPQALKYNMELCPITNSPAQ
jgi:hypothetical protein